MSAMRRMLGGSDYAVAGRAPVWELAACFAPSVVFKPAVHRHEAGWGRGARDLGAVVSKPAVHRREAGWGRGARVLGAVVAKTRGITGTGPAGFLCYLAPTDPASVAPRFGN